VLGGEVSAVSAFILSALLFTMHLHVSFFLYCGILPRQRDIVYL